jgi:hypothetical protein
MSGDLRFQRRQAKQTIISALRIIRDLQTTYSIPTSEVLEVLAVIYRKAGYYDSFRWVEYIVRQIRDDEQRGGR